jgi:secreted PhoX family phosphatase
VYWKFLKQWVRYKGDDHIISYWFWFVIVGIFQVRFSKVNVKLIDKKLKCQTK